MDVEEYRVAHSNGLADASVWNAELHSREVAAQHWQDTIRHLNFDRRDEKLLTRLRQMRKDGKPLGYWNGLVLYMSEHMNVTFAFDPEIEP